MFLLKGFASKRKVSTGRHILTQDAMVKMGIIKYKTSSELGNITNKITISAKKDSAAINPVLRTSNPSLRFIAISL